MRDRSIKYIASIFLFISVGYINPLAAQEGGFMFHEGGGDSYQEKPEAPSSPGTENSYVQPGLKNTYQKDKSKDDIQEKTEESNKQKSTPGNTQPQNKQPATTPSTNNPDAGKDEDSDSVLSFNFLHYIIQRFKFSEVVDE
ncbi:hypothetical protein JMN32_07825 [Fulvivirga sp. 29W222]|uniref:Uncharacterized protein n=1 Tax=Fulvivirga marina TaxID=2494733 RepID=A0A937FWD2_9BACT|nr:hypothetical protein [Fulvivirga marina]MBL6446212.1 hypothetical protein [Fulvivirga marina]